MKMKGFFTLFTTLLVGSIYGQAIFHTIPAGGQGGINDLLTDDQENLFVATTNGVWLHNLYSNPSGQLFNTAHGIQDLPVYNLSRNNAGEIFLTGSNKSFLKFDAQAKFWIQENLSVSHSFSHFTYLYHSPPGTRYFGTDNGLVLTQTSASQTLQEKTQYTNAHNLGSITSISQTSNQNVIAVLSTNGILLDMQGFILPVTAASLLPSDSVISGLMYRDVSYDGTNAGLYVADFSNGPPPSVTTFNTANSAIPSNRIQALAAYGDSIFVGTDKGLAIYNLSSQTWMTLDKNNSNLPTDDITHLTVSSTGRLWIATADNNLSTWSEGIGLKEQKSAESLYQLENRHLIFDQEMVHEDYQILSLGGQLILSGKISSEKISLESLPSGIYWIAVKSKQGQLVGEKLYLP